ncbi:MAG: integrase arm-type DNA-binding domain-containing protein [Terracidiphilus sp.]
MEINKLTDKAIQKAKPGDKDYSMSDGAGLYLLVTVAGGKLWRWGYKFEGKEKLMSYGKYPDIGLAKARDSEWVFPGMGSNNETISDGTILMALNRMGYKGEMTGHGFRGVASTILHEGG